MILSHDVTLSKTRGSVADSYATRTCSRPRLHTNSPATHPQDSTAGAVGFANARPPAMAIQNRLVCILQYGHDALLNKDRSRRYR